VSPASAGAADRKRAAAPAPIAKASGFFVLRTPLLPLDTVTGWSHGLEAPARASDPDALEDAVAGDRLRLRSRLLEIVTEPVFREAIFVASPSLEAAIQLWRKDPDSERGQRAEHALVAYLMRAATRPTPFGLFAGCTTGSIGGLTRLRLRGQDGCRRYTRLDMDYLWALARAIEADPRLRADLRYWPNSSRYEVGDRLLYAEARYSPAGRSYHLVAADKTPYLMQTLERARDGESLDVLANALTSDDISEGDAKDYLGELIDSQLLVAESQPPVTGAPAADAMAATLAAHPATAEIGTRLSSVLTGLAAVDAGGVGASPEAYRQLAGQLDGLPASPDPSRFVQVDLIRPAIAATLAPGVAADILSGVQILHSLSRRTADSALATFREQFTRRYETREMPLAQVLDEETGIGFWTPGQTGSDGGPLMAGLPLRSHQDRSDSWSRRDAFLHRKLTEAIADGRSEISIAADEADAFRHLDQPPLPGAFEVLASVVADSDDGVEQGDYQVVIGSAGGPSGARLLGRFLHADDGLRELAQEHLRAEELTRPDCVFAEIVHLPQGRTGNILSRPVLRQYEIPYLGRSGAAASGQLTLSDLLVSLQGERIVLRSQTLGREVIPRLTAAHNYAQGGLAVYRFLCALQNQDATPGVMWDWGPLRDSAFLPRVVSGRAVLSRATWKLGDRELEALRLPGGASQFSAVQRLRQRLRLPRYVGLVDADNELITDLDNVLCIAALGHQVRRRAAATLVELLPGPGQLCVSGPQGRYAHQIVVPFVRPEPTDTGSGRPVARPGAAVQRRFPPGSEWLYLKLFTGPATADQVLLGTAPLLAASAATGKINSWHFIRYGDPDWHIRLRLHGPPEVLLGDLLPQLRDLTEPLLQTGQIWRTQLDTYERELERYGGPLGIEPAERIFHADSEAVIAIMSQLRGDAGADLRWRVALRGIDQLFDDFGLTLAQRREIARRCKRGYGQELGADSAFEHAVSARFRGERPSLELMIGKDVSPPAEISGCFRALDYRSAAIAAPAASIRAISDSLVPDASGLAELAISLAHMHVNRLLRSAQRAQELVLYEMLDRLYTSCAARQAR
jgi:thiopeptide-type bacteriocin biosynthesis protein